MKPPHGMVAALCLCLIFAGPCALKAQQYDSVRELHVITLHSAPTHDQDVQKLHHYYPLLSPAEVDFALLLLIGGNNHDLAAICRTTPRKIEEQRATLRKKMGLTHDKNLLEEIDKALK